MIATLAPSPREHIGANRDPFDLASEAVEEVATGYRREWP